MLASQGHRRVFNECPACAPSFDARHGDARNGDARHCDGLRGLSLDLRISPGERLILRWVFSQQIVSKAKIK